MIGRVIRVFGILLMLTALAVPLVRAPDRPVATLVARWAPPPSEFVDLKGQLVHYRDEGPKTDPLPIVLLHGTSASLHTWAGGAQALRGERHPRAAGLADRPLAGVRPHHRAPAAAAADRAGPARGVR